MDYRKKIRLTIRIFVVGNINIHPTANLMDVKATENQLIAVYCCADDLLKSFENYRSRNQSSGRKPTRVPGLIAAEVCTILVMYQMSGMKTFEYFYRQYYERGKSRDFPAAPTYERFLELVSRAAPCLLLWAQYLCAVAARGGLYVIDSKKLEVCHPRRERGHKVFKGLAAKGKSSTGWFYGFKIHLVINHLCEIVAFEFTPANVADNNHQLLGQLLGGLKGTCVGDKGYLTTLFAEFLDKGLRLLTKSKSNMRKLPAQTADVRLLNKRAIIETVNDLLASVYDIEHTRHRKPTNALAHMLAALIAYQFQDGKPRFNIQGKNQNRTDKVAA